jgi:hypothetical protein
MFRRLLLTTALATAFVLSSSEGYSQFGGVQVQVGGYGTGVRVGNLGYGNGYYGGYGNGFGNTYYGNYGNYGYRNYSNGYYNNGFGVNNYPNYGYRYVAPRVYSAPIRNYPGRRYRYR